MMRALDDPDLTMGDVLHFHAAQQGDAPALIEGDRQYDYATLAMTVDRLAGALVAQGFAKGDRVTLLAGNGLGFALPALAAMRAGLVLVPINVRLSAEEIAFQICDSGARALIHDRGCGALAEVAATLARMPLRLEADGHDGRLPDWGPVKDYASAELPQIHGGDAAAMFYTSGTTGRPKGAVLTHRNLLVINHHRRTASSWESWNAADVTPLVMPLAHIGGFSVLIRVLFFGASGVLVRDFDAGEMLRLIDRLGVSKLSLVPVMLQRIVQHPDAATTDFSRLKVLNHGAAPIEGDLLARARALIGCGFSQGYGMTETAGVMAALDPAAHATPGRSASTGQALPGVALRIVDEAGQVLPANATGEVAVRSECVMQGYWQRPDEAPVDADGWFATGDAGYLDADGFLFVVGRKKDMIISGGENIYPAEIEDLLLQHPAILEAAVIGVPDPDWGEAVRAVVVARPGMTIDEAEVIAWAKARIARYKAPRAIVVTDVLPRNALGKVLKNALRKV